jgi:CheY-like chemotaxis protein
MQRVLLVEDHPLNRKLFRDILSFEFEVMEAESAEIARERLRESVPDLIVMDVQLPGIDGLTFVRELKSNPRLAQVPIVAVSAHAMPHNIEAARQAGCVEYITKPITDDPFVFLQRLTRLIPGRKSASAPAPGPTRA